MPCAVPDGARGASEDGPASEAGCASGDGSASEAGCASEDGPTSEARSASDGSCCPGDGQSSPEGGPATPDGPQHAQRPAVTGVSGVCDRVWRESVRVATSIVVRTMCGKALHLKLRPASTVHRILAKLEEANGVPAQHDTLWCGLDDIGHGQFGGRWYSRYSRPPCQRFEDREVVYATYDGLYRKRAIKAMGGQRSVTLRGRDGQQAGAVLHSRETHAHAACLQQALRQLLGFTDDRRLMWDGELLGSAPLFGDLLSIPGTAVDFV
eukprot:jgi/Ulvmu1/3578/UM168_0010.1